jgi:para-aminobenzoate synthetase component 1
MSLERTLRRKRPEPLCLEVVELAGDPRDMPEVFDEVAHLPCSCFLDSSLPMERFGRHSFIGFDPFLVLTTRGLKARFESREGEVLEIDDLDPFEALRMALGARAFEEPGVLDGLPPFAGGGIGYMSYELGRYIEHLPASVEDDLDLPELAFGFFDRVVAADLASGRKWLLVSGEEDDDLEAAAASALKRIAPGSGNGAGSAVPAQSEPGTALEFSCGFSRDEYLESVGKVKEYILAGDIYQANLSQRFSAPLLEPAWDLYRRLRVVNAAPFSAYMNLGDFAVASSSPERFLEVDGRRVETRPIKGTSRRYEEPDEDERSRRELLASKKDRAELSMIVDLERNDLGRVCEYGSVQVEEHAVLESYARVHHLVSTVTGTLHQGRDVIDLLRSTFPGGSITGAPKIRSIEIIDELEPTARSVYTGSIGYLGFNGRHDTNIAIRTMIIRGGRVYFQVGGGIVADSEPAAEFEETLDKARAMFEAVTGGGKSA